MLSVEGVTKYYDGKTGIQDISFSCRNGEIAAVIGSNGAGKSTLLKIMAGVLKADTGSVLIDGCDTGEYKNRKQIGYMPDKMELARGLTVRNFLNMVSDYKYEGKYKEEWKQAVIAFGLELYQDREFGKLSLGNQKKAAIIAAVLGSPRLVILDEPANGVDAEGIAALKQTVKALQDLGSIVVVSSHVLDFLREISHTNIYLQDGKMAQKGTHLNGGRDEDSREMQT